MTQESLFAESQNVALLKHLQAGKTITSLEALQLLGSLRLSGRIYDLKKVGHEIQDEWWRTPSGKRVKRYFLKKGLNSASV